MRILIWLLVIYLVYRMVRGKRPPEIKQQQATSPTEFFRDPVCGTYITEADAVVGKLEGERFHFCSMDCLEQFQKIQQQKQ